MKRKVSVFSVLLSMAALSLALLSAGCATTGQEYTRTINEGLVLKEGAAHVDAVIPKGFPDVRVAGATLYGNVAWVHSRGGQVLAAYQGPNLVVDAGKAATAGLLNGVVTNFFEHIAIGTGATAAAAGDTTCQTEITTNGGQRAAGTTSRVTTDVTNDTAQVALTYNFTGSFAVTESCLLDSISAGTLLARQVFSAINVISGDSLLVTWKIDVD